MEGGYCGVIHSIGILFDYTTRLKFMNKWLSGSGNVAKSPKDNYHFINYQTAIKAFWATKRAEINNPNIRFGFVSASETRWRNQWFGRELRGCSHHLRSDTFQQREGRWMRCNLKVEFTSIFLRLCIGGGRLRKCL